MRRSPWIQRYPSPPIWFDLPPHTVEEEAWVSVGLAAEFLDVKPSLLEARRKELFGIAEI